MSKVVMLKDLYLEIDRMKQDVRATREKNGVYILHERFAQDEVKKKRDAPGKVCGAWPFDEPSPHCDSTMFHDQKYLEHSHPLAGVCTALAISNVITNLEGFRDLEFCYVDRGIFVANGVDHDAYPSAVSGGRPSVRQEEKWWLPCPKVPPKGLSEDARKKLQQCRDCTNQILKAALAINSNAFAEMEIPIAYLDTLPKQGLRQQQQQLSQSMPPV